MGIRGGVAEMEVETNGRIPTAVEVASCAGDFVVYPLDVLTLPSTAFTASLTLGSK